MLLIDLFLIGVSILTLWMVITVVYALIYRVPFVPTPAHIADAMIDLVPLQGAETIIDLGAGDGRVLERIKRRYPKCTVIGYEVASSVWLLGYLRAFLYRSGVQMLRKDMFHANLSQADVVFVYLFPEHVRALSTKLLTELRPGSIILTHTFGMPDLTPFAEKEVSRLGGTVLIRAYRVPA